MLLLASEQGLHLTPPAFLQRDKLRFWLPSPLITLSLYSQNLGTHLANYSSTTASAETNTRMCYGLLSLSYCLGFLLVPDFIMHTQSGWKRGDDTQLLHYPLEDDSELKIVFTNPELKCNLNVRFLRIRKSLICLIRALRSSLLLSTCSFVALVLSKTSCAFCFASSALCFASET